MFSFLTQSVNSIIFDILNIWFFYVEDIKMFGEKMFLSQLPQKDMTVMHKSALV